MKTEILEAIKSKLKTRTVEQLKNDVRASMISEQATANIIFQFALSELESRLSAEEYQSFENSL